MIVDITNQKIVEYNMNCDFDEKKSIPSNFFVRIDGHNTYLIFYNHKIVEFKIDLRKFAPVKAK